MRFETVTNAGPGGLIEVSAPDTVQVVALGHESATGYMPAGSPTCCQATAPSVVTSRDPVPNRAHSVVVGHESATGTSGEIWVVSTPEGTVSTVQLAPASVVARNSGTVPDVVVVDPST